MPIPLAAEQSTGSYLVVYILFMIAGLLVGGCWTTYKNDHKILAFVLGACALVAVLGAILWAVGIFQ
ncbi:hypothetical protein PAB09_08650 [Corynebacterium sp. SCR221107]|uniref:hypothetical protein n=1 Tax=Corynebacterium sp. SCR221107 TaxID=3017361 RepID=UPI0022EC40DE|nr:hypothetical protein [Corynebacterium sp. SCR221107]WBT07973.1 hypothetical protein PAB09_08650 [Corynebacterium sp. SCR221107]